MLKKPIKDLKGKNIAIVAMGESQLDFHIARTHSQEFDEVWAINAMAGIIPNPDRVFAMDPMTRFFDTEDAGGQTALIRKTLSTIKCPVYSVELDERTPSVELYPIEAIINDTECGYLNNTVAYAIAFAYWNKVGSISMFGADFTYKKLVYFAEMGRACCEFWLAKCMEQKIEVSIALRSNLLDANVEIKDKLYGYHRLNDPVVSYVENNKMKVCRYSEVIKQQMVPYGISGREDPETNFNDIVEPNKP